MKIAWVPLLLLTAACAARPIYLNHEGKSVAVLPPFNGSNNLEAPEKVWPLVETEMTRRGYAIVPRTEIQSFYAEKGFHLAEEIMQFGYDELAKALKCDFVLVSNVEKWDRKTFGVYTELAVAVEARLYDGRDCAELWKGTGEAGESSSSFSLGGILGNTAGALLSGCDKYAKPATQKCFAKLPLAGFDPNPQPKDQAKPNEAPKQ